jgi:3-oxoacyl-[acyl-carrier-protein] synthase II
MAFAMRGALADAHAAPDHVVHVNAHADATPIGDKAEIIAIRKAFGDAAQGLSVSATKSMTGHLLAGAGPVESIATICALRDAVAPPTINLENPDDDLSEAGLHVAAEPLELTTHAGRAVALNNSSGVGRRNVTLAFIAA